jgi:hypothetical protein
MKLSLVKFALLVCTLYATISLALMVPAVDTSVKARGIEVRDADFPQVKAREPLSDIRSADGGPDVDDSHDRRVAPLTILDGLGIVDLIGDVVTGILGIIEGDKDVCFHSSIGLPE